MSLFTRREVVRGLALDKSLQDHILELLGQWRDEANLEFPVLFDYRVKCLEHLPQLPENIGSQIKRWLNTLICTFQQFAQEPDYFLQCNLLDNCFRLFCLVCETMVNPIDERHPSKLFLESFLQVLIDASVEQVPFMRLRRRLIQQIETVGNKKELMLMGSKTLLQDLLTRRVEKTGEQLKCYLEKNDLDRNGLIGVVKESIVLLEDQCFYKHYLTLHPLSSFSLIMMRFYNCVLGNEVEGRRHWLTFSCVSQTEKHMVDEDFLLILKAVALLIRVLEEVAGLLMHHNTLCLEYAIYSTFRASILERLMKMLTLSSCGKDLLTVLGHTVIHALDQKTSHDWASYLASRLQLKQQRQDSNNVPRNVLVLQTFWNIMPTLSQISLVRNLLCSLSCENSINVSIAYNFLEYFLDQMNYEYPVQSFYATQAIMNWLDHIPVWRKQAQNEKLFEETIFTLCQININYWNSPFKSLGILAYKIWETGMGLVDNSSDTYTSMLTSVRASPNIKYKFSAYSSFISLKSFEWFEQYEPMFLHTLLKALDSPSCRHSILQILLHYIEMEYRKNRNNEGELCELWTASPGLSFLLRELTRENSFFASSNSNVYLVQQSCNALTTSYKDFFIRFLIPALKRQAFQRLFHVWFALVKLNRECFDSVQDKFYKEGDFQGPYETALLAALKESCYATWLNEPHLFLCLSVTRNFDTQHTLRVSFSSLQNALFQADDITRSYAIAIVCHSREQTLAPPYPEWLLLRQILTTSVKANSSNETQKCLRSFERFMKRVVVSCQKASRKKEFYDFQPFLSCLNLLVSHLSRVYSTEFTKIHLRALLFMYEASTELTKYSYCMNEFASITSFSVYSQFIPFLLSSWDEERYLALKLLDYFPCSIVKQGIDTFFLSFFSIFTCSQWREFSGLTDYIVQSSRKLSHFASTCTEHPPSAKEASPNTLTTQQQHQTCPMSCYFSQSTPSATSLFEIFQQCCPTLGQTGYDALYIKSLARLRNNTPLIPVINSFNLIHLFLTLIKVSLEKTSTCGLSAYFSVISSSFRHLSLTSEKMMEHCNEETRPMLRQCTARLVKEIFDTAVACINFILKLFISLQNTALLSPDLRQPGILDISDLATHLDCRGHMILSKEACQRLAKDENIHANWMIIRYAAETLESLFKWFRIDPFLNQQDRLFELTPNFFETHGRQLIALCLSMKHPAVTDRLARAILAFSVCLTSSIHAFYKRIPRLWLLLLLRLLVPHLDEEPSPLLPLPPPLRRSFSLGQTFVALLSCDTSSGGETMGFLALVMQSLLTFLQVQAEKTFQQDQSLLGAVAHCLNICRSLVRSGFYFNHRANYLDRLFNMALHYSNHSLWNLRNAANLLLTTTIERLVETISKSHSELVSCSFDSFLPFQQILGRFLHPKGFSFLCGSFYRHQQLKPIQGFLDLSASYPKIFHSVKHVLEAKGSSSSSQIYLHDNQTMNALLFLSRVDLTKDNAALFPCIEFWRDQGPSALVRLLASHLAHSTFSLTFFQPLLTPCQNNTLFGRLAALLNHVSESSLTNHSTRVLLMHLQDVFIAFTKEKHISNIAPLNHALFVQCVERLFYQIESDATLHDLKIIINDLSIKISQFYLEAAKQHLFYWSRSRQHTRSKTTLTFYNKQKLFIPHTNPSKPPQMPNSLHLPTQSIVDIRHTFLDKPKRIKTLLSFIPGQSATLYTSALRLFLVSAPLSYIVEQCLIFLPGKHCLKLSQETCHSFFFPFFKEFFRVAAYRFTSHDAVEPNLLNSWMSCLYEQLEHFLLASQRPLCCLAFLSCTALEKLSLSFFKLIIQFFLSHTANHANFLPIQTNVKHLPHSPSALFLEYFKKIILLVHNSHLCHHEKAGVLFSQSLLVLMQQGSTCNSLLNILAEFIQSSSLPSAHMTSRWRCIKIFQQLGLPLLSFSNKCSISTSQDTFNFALWTSSAFLLADENPEIVFNISRVLSQTFFCDSFINSLQQVDSQIAEALQSLRHHCAVLLPRVCYYYLLRILFLAFDHSRILQALVSKTLKLQKDDQQLVELDSQTPWFEKEPLCYSTPIFLHSIYFVYRFFRSSSSFPLKCNLEKEKHFITQHEKLLQTPSLISWMNQLNDPLAFYINTSQAMNVYQAALHYDSSPQTSQKMKTALQSALACASSRGVLIPPYLNFFCKTTSEHFPSQSTQSTFPYEQFPLF